MSRRKVRSGQKEIQNILAETISILLFEIEHDRGDLLGVDDKSSFAG
jgi:hypothetical protein